MYDMYHLSLFSDEQDRNSFEFNVPLLEDVILQDQENDSDDEDKDNYDHEKQRPLPPSFLRTKYLSPMFYLCQLPLPLFSLHQAKKKSRGE